MRPDGNTRHGLFSLSSSIETGCRWLLMSNGRRLIQTQNMVSGILRMISDGVETVDVSNPKAGAAQALKVPKTVFGMTIVFMSLLVKSHIECAWYQSVSASFDRAVKGISIFSLDDGSDELIIIVWIPVFRAMLVSLFRGQVYASQEYEGFC